jgi:predicted HicB family RNase H-like nuclease
MAPLRSKSGRALTDEVVNELAHRMERGYEPGQLQPRKAGRPPLGDEHPSPRIQVRVSQRLYVKVSQRARQEGKTVSALVRQLLEKYAGRGTSGE